MLLRRFGSVKIFNGHIHQIAQKVEGKMIFHTARSIAFPQPAPALPPRPAHKSCPPTSCDNCLASHMRLSRADPSPSC